MKHCICVSGLVGVPLSKTYLHIMPYQFPVLSETKLTKP